MVELALRPECHRVDIFVSGSYEATRDRDAAFAVHETGGVGPVCGLRFSQRERPLGGPLQGRLAVQAAHEDLERQSRLLEVSTQQLEIGPGLL